MHCEERKQLPILHHRHRWLVSKPLIEDSWERRGYQENHSKTTLGSPIVCIDQNWTRPCTYTHNHNLKLCIKSWPFMISRPPTNIKSQSVTHYTHVYTHTYRSVPGKCPWALKHNSQFGQHGRLPGIKIPYACIETAHWSLEMGYMGAYLGVGACPGHYGTYNVCIHTCMYMQAHKTNARALNKWFKLTYPTSVVAFSSAELGTGK